MKEPAVIIQRSNLNPVNNTGDSIAFFFRLNKLMTYLNTYSAIDDGNLKMKIEEMRSQIEQFRMNCQNQQWPEAPGKELLEFEDKIDELCAICLRSEKSNSIREFLSTKIQDFCKQYENLLSDEDKIKWASHITNVSNQTKPMTVTQMNNLIKDIEDARTNLVKNNHNVISSQLKYLEAISGILPQETADLVGETKCIALLLKLSTKGELDNNDAEKLVENIDKLVKDDWGMLNASLKSALSKISEDIKTQLKSHQPVNITTDKHYEYLSVLRQIAIDAEEKTKLILAQNLQTVLKEYLNTTEKFLQEYGSAMDPNKKNNLERVLTSTKAVSNNPISGQALHLQLAHISEIASNLQVTVLDNRKIDTITDLAALDQINNMVKSLEQSPKARSTFDAVNSFKTDKWNDPSMQACTTLLDKLNNSAIGLNKQKEDVSNRKEAVIESLGKSKRAEQEFILLKEYAIANRDVKFTKYLATTTFQNDMKSGKALNYVTLEDIAKMSAPPRYTAQLLFQLYPKTMAELMLRDIKNITNPQFLENLNATLNITVSNINNEQALNDLKSNITKLEDDIRALKQSPTADKESIKHTKENLEKAKKKLLMTEKQIQAFQQSFVTNGLMKELQNTTLTAVLNDGSNSASFKRLLAENPDAIAKKIQHELKNFSNDSLNNLLKILEEPLKNAEADNEALIDAKRKVNNIHSQLREAKKSGSQASAADINNLEKAFKEAQNNLATTLKESNKTLEFRKAFIDSGLIAQMQERQKELKAPITLSAAASPNLLATNSTMRNKNWTKVADRSNSTPTPYTQSADSYSPQIGRRPNLTTSPISQPSPHTTAGWTSATPKTFNATQQATSKNATPLHHTSVISILPTSVKPISKNKESQDNTTHDSPIPLVNTRSLRR